MTNAHQLAHLVRSFSGVRVLCVGDVMVDRYIYGRVDRVSPEAPIPIMSHDSERMMLGAVGNVARNIGSLGGHASIIAVVGDDDAGRDIVRLIAEDKNLEADLVTVAGRRTSVKTRYVSRGQQLLRADQEDTDALKDDANERLLAAIRAEMPEHQALVLSDYAKGCLNDRVLSGAIAAAREAGIAIVVDPKHRDLTRYNGATVLKPNLKELETATGQTCSDEESVARACKAAFASIDVDALLVTRSEQGMTLVPRVGAALHVKDRVAEVFDVSGAGDTAIAVMALSLGAQASFADAAVLANKACSIVVGKVGTATVYTSELLHALQAAELDSAELKILSPAEATDAVARWRSKGAVVGFTNGCFDLIHAGHVSLLSQAKATCDRLIVGLNDDESVRRLKGEGRPINAETARAVVLASFADVDAVVLFEDDTPMELIEAIRPDVLIKGADYRENQVVGGDFVRSYGGRVVLAELMPESSTTRTIGKIRS